MDVSKWFYRPHYTTPELDKRLRTWKRRWGSNCLYGKNIYRIWRFRQYGETTAKILRLLITPGKIVDFTEQPRGDRERFLEKNF